MARIDLRDCTIRLKDGLSGTCNITEAAPGANDTDVDVDTVALVGPANTQLIPVGARFTVPNISTVFTVTGRLPASAGPTTNVTFTPAWGSVNTPVVNADMTFLPQQLDITIGEGNLTYTEAKEYEYILDRGVLDTVREGDDQPVEVSLEFAYEYVTTGTNEAITPVDAIKKINGAVEWVSSSADLCEPYAVDLEIERVLNCGTAEDEITLLSDFRFESLEYSLQDATISVSGKCNVTDATVTRQ
jgi:hypothetical protein